MSHGLAGANTAVRPGFAIALTLALGLPGLLLLTHPYVGIWHDALLYTVQAFRHLEPRFLNNDLFFRYGSQDSFTLFSPLYAWLIQTLGVESAAHLLARVSLLAECAAVWLLARRLMGAPLTWLALALFIAAPANYGAWDLLNYAESFTTPRGFAETFSLLGLAALLSGRRALCALALLLALLMHPLLALPAALVAVLLATPERWQRSLYLAGAAATIGVALLAQWHPIGRLSLIDPAWLDALQVSVRYLFVENWYITDWQPPAITFATLCAAMLVLPEAPPRQLARAALTVGLAGMALQLLIYVAPVVLWVQGQPWRWLWLSKAVSVVLLPLIAPGLWRLGTSGRGALALLALGWSAPVDPVGVVASVCAVLALVIARRRPDWRAAGRAFGVLALVGAIALLWGDHSQFAGLRVGLVAAAWWAVFRPPVAWLRLVPLAAASLLFCVQVVSAATDKPWTTVHAPHYDATNFGAFAPWRARIAAGATVLNPEHPELVWMLLHRQSYFGLTGSVFSRDAALESERRRRLLTTVFPGLLSEAERAALDPAHRQAYFGHPGSDNPPITVGEARTLCDQPGIDYLMLKDLLPVRYLRNEGRKPLNTYLLYACTDIRA